MKRFTMQKHAKVLLLSVTASLFLSGQAFAEQAAQPEVLPEAISIENLKQFLYQEDRNPATIQTGVDEVIKYFDIAAQAYLKAHYLRVKFDEKLEEFSQPILRLETALGKNHPAVQELREAQADKYNEFIITFNKAMAPYREILKKGPGFIATAVHETFNAYYLETNPGFYGAYQKLLHVVYKRISEEWKKDDASKLALLPIIERVVPVVIANLKISAKFNPEYSDVAAKQLSVIPLDIKGNRQQLVTNFVGVLENISETYITGPQAAENVAEMAADKATLTLLAERSQKAWDSLKDENPELHKLNIDIETEWKDYQAAGTTSKAVANGMTVGPDSGSAGNLNGRRFPRGKWTLTFDDGPHSSRSNAIIRNLDSYGYKATFFWMSPGIKRFRTLANSVAREHILANHSETHANLARAGASKLDREIAGAQRDITDTVGIAPKFFRLPYGAGAGNGSAARQKIADTGLIHVFWNVDTLDWQDRDPRSIYNRAKQQMANQGKGIILFHDIHQQSVEASRRVMELIRADYQYIDLCSAVDAINGSGDYCETGDEPSDPPPPDDDDGSDDDTADIIWFDNPKRLQITTRSDHLSVRSTPVSGGSSNLCGGYAPRSYVYAVGKDRDTGWYVIDTDSSPPVRHNNSARPSRCQDIGYISDDYAREVR